MTDADITGGGYKGEAPSDSAGSIPVGSKVKIGNNYYADLESAIADANQSPTDVVIEILDDVTLHATPVNLGNTNGKTITIDLGGHNVTSQTGGGINVVSPGKALIKDSTATASQGGTMDVDIVVQNNARLEIEENTDIGGAKGNITNNGTVDNKGTILGKVTNSNGGGFVNHPDGVIMGEVDNSGTFTNNGNIEDDVTNRGNGSFTNASTGKVNAQVENKDNATTTNSGDILQVNITGGRLNNNSGGLINNLLQVGGELENKGDIKDMEGVAIILSYVDSSGNTKQEYVSNIEEAIEIAGTINADVTLTLKEDLPQKENIVINKPNGKLNIDLNGHSIGTGSKTIELSTGNLTIKDTSEESSGGVLSPIKQTGGTMKLEDGDYYGITLAPSDSKMKTDLSGGTFSKAPGTNQNAITVIGSNPQNTLLNALGTDTIRKDDNSGTSISVDSNGNISLGTGSGEKLVVTTPSSEEGIKSDLELVQKLNTNNKANSSLTSDGVKLNQNITLDKTLEVDGDVSLDLNGKTLVGPNGDRKLSLSDERDQTGKPAINLNDGSNINIKDSSGGGSIQGGRGASTMQSGVGAGVGGPAISTSGSGNINNQGSVQLKVGDNGFALGNTPPEIILNKETRHPELLNQFFDKLYDLDVKVKIDENIETVSENSIVQKDVKVSLDIPEILNDIGVKNNTIRMDVSINVVQKEHKLDDPDEVAVNAIKDYLIENQELVGEDSVLGMVVDITLKKSIWEKAGDVETQKANNEPIHTLGHDLYFTINLPANMQGGSDYRVIRDHGGVLSLITPTLDNPSFPTALTFSSRDFSSFGIVYTPRQNKGNINDGSNGTSHSGGRKPVIVEKPEAAQPVYRLYNEINGDHLLTTSQAEKDACIGYGWSYEGVAFLVKNEGEKVYRLYNLSTGEHLYTISDLEKNVLTANGWRYEGVAFITNGDNAVYRLYNNSIHLFTAGETEKTQLISSGWQLEGVAFKAS